MESVPLCWLVVGLATGVVAVVVALPVSSASSWKFSKLFGPDSTALIENTMPAAQWPVWPQYPQIGAVWGKRVSLARMKSRTGVCTYVVDRDLERGEGCGVGGDGHTASKGATFEWGCVMRSPAKLTIQT